MEFYDIDKCPLTHGDCIQEDCRFFRRPEQLPATCRAREILIKYKDLLDFFSNLT